MGYTLTQQQNTKQSQSLKQTQRLMISPQMQQAIHLLQLPVLELSEYVSEELAQNPIMESVAEEEEEIEEDFDTEDEEIQEENTENSLKFDENDFEILKRLDEDFRDHFSQTESVYSTPSSSDDKLKAFQESLIVANVTLADHLLQQAHECFGETPAYSIAEEIIGSLNDRGLFDTPLEEIALTCKVNVAEIERVLTIIQSFHPPGIAAKSLRESLLNQLIQKNKDQTLAYQIIDQAFEDLIQNRIPQIRKTLKCTQEEITDAIENTIRKLDLHPGFSFSTQATTYMIPDVSIRKDGEQLVVSLHEDSLPRLKLNSKYLRMLDQEGISQEEKEFIKQKMGSAKWLIRNLFERSQTIERIAQVLVDKQKNFLLDPNGQLTSLTMKTVADELGLHESTIARAVANKSIDTPRGLYPLRFFFSGSFITDQGEDISSNAVRDVLLEIIQKEDKKKPLSDQAISDFMKAKGIPCARRTIAKYRTAFNIGNALQRKKF